MRAGRRAAGERLAFNIPLSNSIAAAAAASDILVAPSLAHSVPLSDKKNTAD